MFHLNPQPTAITRFSDGTFLSVNDAFLKMTGFSRDEIIGKTSVEAGHLDRRGAGAVLSRSLQQSASAEYDVPFRSKDGRLLMLCARQRATSTSAASRAWSTWRPT